MPYIMLYLLSLLPIFIYLWILSAMDAFQLVQRKQHTLFMLWGMVSTGIMYGITQLYIHVTGEPWQSVWISPIVEELLKGTILLILVARRKIVFLAEAFIYGGAIGAGFALAENIIYITVFPTMSPIVALIRGLGTAMLHMGCTATAASVLLLLSYMLKDRFTWTLIPLSFVPGYLLHVAYNYMLLDPMIQLAIVVAGCLLYFLTLTSMHEKMMIKWFDISMTDHVQLLASIREGSLADNKTGQYLQSIKNRVDALVFFDMIVYMELYLELVLLAKSRIMLKEINLAEPLSAQQRQDISSKLQEMNELNKRIPLIGKLLLKPVIHQSKEDEWAMKKIY